MATSTNNEVVTEKLERHFRLDSALSPAGSSVTFGAFLEMLRSTERLKSGRVIEQEGCRLQPVLKRA